MRFIATSYSMLLVALLQANANPIVNSKIGTALPVHAIHFTSRRLLSTTKNDHDSRLTLSPQSVRFTVRSLPVTVKSLGLPPIQQPPPPQPDLPANVKATAVYNSIASVFDSTIKYTSIVDHMAEITAKAVCNTIQLGSSRPNLPASMTQYIRDVCNTVANTLPKSLANSVALVTGQTTYNLLKPKTATNDWPGPQQLTKSLPTSEAHYTVSFFLRWTIGQQARNTVNHVLKQIVQTWPFSHYDNLRPVNCGLMNNIDCQWLRTTMDSKLTMVQQSLQRSIDSILTPHLEKFRNDASDAVSSALSD
ncbi:hypothetical protein BDF19DRAFT_443610 [Syncephalis fuscata]|nr:hypothetical protein BDF19DRAFT_443610 [Syncephalis fuscata]